MFDKKRHDLNKELFNADANENLEEFKTSLTGIVYLSGREYKLIRARFYSLKKSQQSNSYDEDSFEEFAHLEMLVVEKYGYQATLGRKSNSNFWQYIPNTAMASSYVGVL